MTRSNSILLLIAVFTISFHSSTRAEDAAPSRMPKAKLEPFLQEFCVRCHGPEKQKGQVRFDEGGWEISTNDEAQRWQDVLDQLNGGDMPPEDEKQPAAAELSLVLDSLTGSLLTARKR
ncbi:MAG: hypothetical protein ACI8UO_006824, partial [Verrucomicrobiales bacterium]